MSMVGANSFAYDIAVMNGYGKYIYYNYINNRTELEVTHGDRSGDEDSNRKGELIIPAELSYNNKTYKVTRIGDYAFNYCRGLTSVTIPNSVTSIGKSAFYECSGLTSLTIPNSVATIGEHTFSGCSGLTSLTIGSGLTTIEDCMFTSCKALTSVTIPNSVTSIGKYAFAGCPIKNFQMPNNVQVIGEMAFFDCEITTVTIPSSVTRIDKDAFCECTKLSSVRINDIANWCKISFGNEFSNPLYFARYLYLDNQEIRINDLTIPDGVRVIKRYAFVNLRTNTIIIPKSVMNIGDYAFYNVNCQYIISLIEDPFVINLETFYSSQPNTNILYVPKGTKNKYMNSYGWSRYLQIVECNLDAVDEVMAPPTPSLYYTIEGRRIANPCKGINIIRTSKGETKKVVAN